MRTACALLLCSAAALTLHGSDHRHLVGPFSIDPALDCATRNFTWAFALSLLPSRAPLLSVFDALRLAIDCNQTRPSLPAPAPAPPFYAAAGNRVLRTLPLPMGAFFVDASAGSDGNSGSEAAPFATPARALAATRAAGGGGAIVLRGGAPFDLRAPLVLTPQDSGLTLTAYPGEAPVLSGGMALPPLAWSRVGPSPNSSLRATIWATPLPPGLAAPFSSLWGPPSSRRATRARWPNGSPEDLTGLLPNGYTKASQWLPPPVPLTPQASVHPQLDPRTEPRAACPADACTSGGPSGSGPPWAIFCCFFWGTNGSVENFTAGSFWGSQPGPPGGPTFHSPGGLIAGADLAPRLRGWSAPQQAIVHAFQGEYWGNWMWRVGGVNASTGAVLFGEGGWQEARGGGAGDYFYIENVREELDAPGEWWADGTTLFYCANGTLPPSAEGWVAGELENILTLAGTPSAPVRDITLAGLTFSFTEPTFLRHFTASGGGDWSYQDGGALRFVGTRNCSVSGSLFVNLGGNGVMLSGWNKGGSVTDSEFQWLGENAVVSGGDGSAHDNSAPDAPVGEGLLVARNIAHELGLFVKQAGFFYQTMSANTTVKGNVLFNGPRAGINLNDDYGGGHLISNNAAFNLVRESSDHGPFNSWARNTYRWRAGAGGTDQLISRIHANLWVANYFATIPIDHDVSYFFLVCPQGECILKRRRPLHHHPTTTTIPPLIHARRMAAMATWIQATFCFGGAASR